MRREIQHLCDGGLVLSFPPTYWLNSTKRDSSPTFSSRHRVVATNWATGTFACWSPSVSGGARDMGDGESPTIASALRCEGVPEGGVKHVVVGARCCTGDSGSRWMGRERKGRPGEVPRPTGDCATDGDGGSVERPTRTWRSRMLTKARAGESSELLLKEEGRNSKIGRDDDWRYMPESQTKEMGTYGAIGFRRIIRICTSGGTDWNSSRNNKPACGSSSSF